VATNNTASVILRKYILGFTSIISSRAREVIGRPVTEVSPSLGPGEVRIDWHCVHDGVGVVWGFGEG
jgi:hypothetical protein